MKTSLKLFLLSMGCLAGLPASLMQAAPAIPLEVLEPAERKTAIQDFPVSVGLVFPERSLKGFPGGCLIGEKGQTIPFEAEATCWWNPEKTDVKWLLLKFNASTDRRYTFKIGKKAPANEGRPLAAERDGEIEVDTGSLMARVSTQKPSLFSSVLLNGQPMVAALEPSHVLTLADGQNGPETKVTAWKAEIEENSPARATLRAKGTFLDPSGNAVAALELRYQFFKGESFVRVYHTLTWMVQDWRVGVREISMRLKPAVGDQGTVRLGLSDFSADGVDTPWQTDTSLYAFQEDAEHYKLILDGKPIKAGQQLGGWLALEGGDGRGVAVCLREMWQMFPKALAVRNGAIQIQLWPEQGKRMGFDYEDVLPPVIYHSEEWKRYPWSKEKGLPISEYATNPCFMQTAEGAARTHELLIHFYDRKTKRSPAEINSLTQHPLVIRQDPRDAMRVPFMGLEIVPVQPDKSADIERAVDTSGRLAVARWPDMDYGFWRFGMIRWSAPNEGYYRWFGGVQYDSQLIPWLLFLRGGGRDFFEDGERTARFAMDVATNHYSTRRSDYYRTAPVAPGYQAGAGCTPFPLMAMHLGKSIKIHFLQYYYHLTGYLRARDVMREVIAGAKWAAKNDVREKTHPAYRGNGRELFNVNILWANIYEETFDPEVKELAREWRDLTLNREYDPELRAFRQPMIYLFNGLIPQDRLWRDPGFKAKALAYLNACGYPAIPNGGIEDVASAIACGWAYEQTRDKGYGRIAWDLSRTLADLVPAVKDWNNLPRQVPIFGNAYYRDYLMPMLVGLTEGRRLNLKANQPPRFHDTFIALDMAAAKNASAHGKALVRPARNGKLVIRILLKSRWGEKFAPVKITATGPDAAVLAETTVAGELPKPAENAFYPHGWNLHQGILTIPAAKKDQTYTLSLEGADGKITALVLADAQVVFEVPLGRPIDFQSLAGQDFSGGHIYARTTQDTVTIRLGHRYPYALRDANTWELLYLSPLDPPESTTHSLGKNRLICLVTRGCTDILTIVDGVAPYFSTTREGWFDPNTMNEDHRP